VPGLARTSAIMLRLSHLAVFNRAKRKVRSAILWLLAVLLGFLLRESLPQPGSSFSNGHSIASSPIRRQLPAIVSVSSEQKQMLGISVAIVERTYRRQTLHLPGRVAKDENRVYRLSVGVDGFVKETNNDTIGSFVRKNQRLAIIYSHELSSAIDGYLRASGAPPANFGKKGEPELNVVAMDNWVLRLRNLGMSDIQIKELYSTHQNPEGVYILSPEDGYIVARNVSPGLKFEKNMEFYRIADLRQVWIVADLFGGDSQYVRRGTVARITFPGQRRPLSARVSYISAGADPVTRTLKLRLEAENRGLALRPGMFVDVELTAVTALGLSVPAAAVLDSGLYSYIFVDRDNGHFESRRVNTGERYGDRVQILSGLTEGEKVAANAAFLIDSESRVKLVADKKHAAAAN
jgi:membrane fusion protein, copper/silver efflux system